MLFSPVHTENFLDKILQCEFLNSGSLNDFGVENTSLRSVFVLFFVLASSLNTSE